MPLFGRSNRARGTSAAVSRTNRRGNFGSHFRRNKDPDRVAGGYKAALSNPNTTRTGRARAKRELKAMQYPDTLFATVLILPLTGK
ncbi:hypothetical protein PHLCEN_2v10757 [Hermanssonia centrifuga]|uniref:Uncharacterized protein n=1 Tax=Hermanssonia centrifuga TaxID=98765 RepID=A0A2R6NM46_9APHY|nr:hypothetical protein PHLCEN_2v10757 [Hermanssonia centrifuga]